MDVWVAMSPANAARLVRALKDFGFDVESLKPELFLNEKSVVRLGEPPIRTEILTSIDGVTFANCYARRTRGKLDGLRVNLINREHLKQYKAASGRPKDLDDLEHLGEA